MGDNPYVFEEDEARLAERRERVGLDAFVGPDGRHVPAVIGAVRR